MSLTFLNWDSAIFLKESSNFARDSAEPSVAWSNCFIAASHLFQSSIGASWGLIIEDNAALASIATFSSFSTSLVWYAISLVFLPVPLSWAFRLLSFVLASIYSWIAFTFLSHSFSSKAEVSFSIESAELSALSFTFLLAFAKLSLPLDAFSAFSATCSIALASSLIAGVEDSEDTFTSPWNVSFIGDEIFDLLSTFFWALANSLVASVKPSVAFFASLIWPTLSEAFLPTLPNISTTFWFSFTLLSPTSASSFCPVIESIIEAASAVSAVIVNGYDVKVSSWILSI